MIQKILDSHNGNVAEYILFMWQMEDVVRAMDFDLENIEYNILRPATEDEAEIRQDLQWFEDLIKKMRSDKIEKKGHLIFLNELLTELFYLHSTLLNVSKDDLYVSAYELAKPFILEFREKSDSKSMNDIEICLQGLYSKLLLKIQKKEISEETEKAFDQMRNLIAHLVARYKKMKEGSLNFSQN